MQRAASILAICLLLSAGTASAVTWVILPDGTGDAPTIQAGIDYASAGDTVRVMSGTYYEHDIWLESGITLISETGLRTCVTIDAQGLGRVFACSELDNTTSVTGFTAINGIAIQGGGMYCYDSDAGFAECRFMNNSAVDTNGVRGGGVYLVTGNSVFTDCDFISNSAVCQNQPPGCPLGEGGGVFAEDGAPHFIRCTFADNSVECECDASGGGFSCRNICSPTFEECTFDSNFAGGAKIPLGCDAVLTGCVFRGNVAAPCCVGGGMLCRSDDAVITNCRFEGNSGPEGAGITFRYSSATLTGCEFYDNLGSGACLESSSSPTFTNCVFAGNHEAALPWGFGGGGLLLSNESTAYLTGCTFWGNSTDKDGGGIFCGESSDLTLDHCIISFSSDGEALYWDGTGSEPELYCCNLYGNEGGDWVGEIADQYGTNGNISEDPVFCDPYGYDFHLSIDSPCLDADTCGVIGTYGQGCQLTFDILYIGDHPQDHGGFVDMTWHRIGYDSTGSDTLVGYYSVWRRMDSVVLGGAARDVSMMTGLGDPPGVWVRVDSVPATGAPNYSCTCPTACDSTESGGVCWSVFYVKAHCAGPVLEFDTQPDSAYSVANLPAEAWTDVTTMPPLGNTALGAGFAWVDYDNDDDLDIFVTNRGASDKVFRNDSLTAGGFRNALVWTLLDPDDCRGAAWGDYDDDGDLDLYVSKNGSNRLYRNNGSEDFSDVTPSPLDDSNPGQTVSWADYDNDGDLDLYLVNNGPNRLFRNDGGAFTAVAGGPLENAAHGMGCGWADYDDDGDLDLYIANYDSTNVLMQNQGGGIFVDATTTVLEIPGMSCGVAWGDYDNDGDLDLYVTNNGDNVLLRNDRGTFVDVTSSPIGNGGNGRSAAWGDYDLDGDLDLYVINYAGTNRLFRNEGGGVFTIPECAASCVSDNGKGFSGGWGDYDKDGDLDLYVVNDGTNRLFRNDLFYPYHWLEVCLAGDVSNSYGQGARVRVVAGGKAQMREVAGASGYLSQGPLSAFFGLGAAAVVDTVEVTWPSGGAVQVLTGVGPDQSLEIFETDLAGLAPDGVVRVLRLYACRPNPFARLTTVVYDLPDAASVDLSVFDVSGKSVRRLVANRSMDPGRHRAAWNGHNDSGRPVAPGIYFIELAAGSRRELQRVVLLR
jgi:parallel beta-helix repeat protein